MVIAYPPIMAASEEVVDEEGPLRLFPVESLVK